MKTFKQLIDEKDYTLLTIGTNCEDRPYIQVLTKCNHFIFAFIKKKYVDVEFQGEAIGERDQSDWSYDGPNTDKDKEELEWLFSMCFKPEIEKYEP